MRGLKLPADGIIVLGYCRTLMGAWIETPLYRVMSLANPGRTLMGAWIETTAAPGRKWSRSVAPLWVRGLKHHKPLAGR